MYDKCSVIYTDINIREIPLHFEYHLILRSRHFAKRFEIFVRLTIAFGEGLRSRVGPWRSCITRVWQDNSSLFRGVLLSDHAPSD